jgi:hypothetical protein
VSKTTYWGANDFFGSFVRPSIPRRWPAMSEVLQNPT